MKSVVSNEVAVRQVLPADEMGVSSITKSGSYFRFVEESLRTEPARSCPEVYRMLEKAPAASRGAYYHASQGRQDL